MQGQIKECWRELCERAVNEQDPAKFLVIVREINVLLEVKTGRFKQRRPQLVQDAPHLPRCSLCDKPVLLETSKTDENAKAVHEECYVLKMRLKQATIPPEA
ncbi:MAG: hypothetical protein WCA20_00925 [Candidatus Sulfotelmatobacter sp.]